MNFRPCIDLHKGKVKQIVGNTLSDSGEKLQTNFETDLPSSHYAKIYKSDKLYGGHIIMLGPGNEQAAITALEAFPGGFQIGGGITPLTAGRFLNAGASHVIVTSYVFEDGQIKWEKLQECTKILGKEHLVLDLSCKKVGDQYLIATDRWQKLSQEPISEALLDKLKLFCSEFLVHAAHVEGMQSGVDMELIEKLAAWSPLLLTYAGGVRSIDDLEMIYKMGNGRVDDTVGSALDLFGGTLSYKEVVDWHKRNLNKNG